MKKKTKEMDDWMGFNLPNTTPTPNQFYDEALARIDNLAELKCVLYVIRRTYGFAKLIDRISYSQFVNGITKRDGTILDRGTGLTGPSVNSGLQKAIEHDYLVRYIVCPHCLEAVTDRVIIEYTMTPRTSKTREPVSVKKDAPPHLCPHCNEHLRGREEIYYSLSFVGNHIDYTLLKSLVWHHKDFNRGLLKMFNTQEIVVQEKETTTPIPKKSKPQTDYLDTLLAKKEPQSHREHILEAISVKLNLPLPESDGQYKVWEKALDSIVVECRGHAKKKRLDAALTKDIVAAIRAAKSEKGGYPFETADQPHTGVVARIVKAFRNREWVAVSPYANVREL